MKKIIIRKRFQRCIGSQYINLTRGEDYGSIKELLKEYSLEEVVSKVYGDNYESYNKLLEEYSRLRNRVELGESCKSNDNFYVAYQLNDKYAVEIDEHITLLHLETPLLIGEELIVPWYVASADMYYGDPWWSEDEEILHDLLTMNTIQFMEEYKGF